MGTFNKAKTGRIAIELDRQFSRVELRAHVDGFTGYLLSAKQLEQVVGWVEDHPVYQSLPLAPADTAAPPPNDRQRLEA